MPYDVGAVLERLGVSSRRRGRRFWGEECPLSTHRGRQNPTHRWQNFFVRAEEPRAGQYHCFSCKGGGTLVELVEDVRELDRAGARAWLDELGEVEAVPYVRVRFQPRGPRTEEFRIPPEVEFGPPEGWTATPREYLARRRVTAEQVARWRIGRAHVGRLANRIVLPVFDGRGAPANYAARTFVDDEVRYQSADERREHPDKSALWGEHFWPPAGERRTTLLAFEGAINGLALERALLRIEEAAEARGEVVELPYFGGISGSNFDHRKALKYSTWRRVIIATDPDKAGNAVAAQIATACKRSDVGRFEYPSGQDADDTPIEALAEALAPWLSGSSSR